MVTQTRRTLTRSKKIRTLLTMFLMALMTLGTVTTASASSSDSAEAERQLQQYAYKTMAGNSYQLEGGGSIQGMSLFRSTGLGNYQIDQGALSTLSSEGQKQFAKDLMTTVESSYDPQNPDKKTQTPLVDQSTAQNWIKEIQSIDGVGMQLLIHSLDGTNPDLVEGRKIFGPVQNPIAIILGVGVLLFFTLFALSTLIDFFYVTIPFARIAIDGSKSGKENKAWFVTKEARKAVEEAESINKSALGIWAKKRAIIMIAVGLVLLLLVSGQFWNVVGWIMNLVSGLF